MATYSEPSQLVLSAFNISSPAVPLPGGEGTSFLAGNAVLKPISNLSETNWRSDLLSALNENGFRISRPIKTQSNEWVYDGWQAFSFVTGHEIKGRWIEKISTSRLFHAELSKFPKPDFIDSTTHPWGVADRMVWGEQSLEYGPQLNQVVSRLLPHQTKLNLPQQLIHGDLTGNILFADSLPPAIIDFSPYWRPAEYANAIIIVDSIVWEGAPDSLMDQFPNSPSFNQLLVRAALWRIITTELCIAAFGKGDIGSVNSYHHFIDLVESRISHQLSLN